MASATIDEVLTELPGEPACGMLLLVDHASNRVPDDIALDMPPALMSEHVALDIGADPLARALCERLGCPGVLAAVSRLVIDLNREEDAPGLIPAASDGHAVPGNRGIDAAARAERIARFWRPYHDYVSRKIATDLPKLLISLHSFTPRLATTPVEPRPWQIGVLYNTDDRAARIAIPLLTAAGIVTGDNLPYSGRVLNASMNRHAEANGIAYLGLEVRQDLIGDPAGVSRWCDTLAPIISATARALAGVA